MGRLLSLPPIMLVLHERPKGTDKETSLFSAVHAQTAGHLTGSEAQGGCNSLGRLSGGELRSPGLVAS